MVQRESNTGPRFIPHQRLSHQPPDVPSVGTFYLKWRNYPDRESRYVMVSSDTTAAPCGVPHGCHTLLVVSNVSPHPRPHLHKRPAPAPHRTQPAAADAQSALSRTPLCAPTPQHFCTERSFSRQRPSHTPPPHSICYAHPILAAAASTGRKGGVGEVRAGCNLLPTLSWALGA